jgi:hypothetical protein
VIFTDSLNTMMAASGINHTKNPKPRKITKCNTVTCWNNDEKYPPEDLNGWIKTEMAGSRHRRWEKGESAKKERKNNTGWQNDTEKLKRGDQVAVTRLRTGYNRAHTVTKWKESRTQTARFAAQNPHYNTSYGSAKKQRKKDERVI